MLLQRSITHQAPVTASIFSRPRRLAASGFHLLRQDISSYQQQLFTSRNPRKEANKIRKSLVGRRDLPKAKPEPKSKPDTTTKPKPDGGKNNGPEFSVYLCSCLALFAYLEMRSNKKEDRS